ncbi:Stress response protein NhaX [Paenibacillus konkukensis]|uniref:Stress response protein NhaX n=1 Tax=Paenibacillus konkukensis TaxID=2020716 RepID=A0ABY4RTZ3_9BACL|nr:universal stress protein [Paenibacillus konkukensis]UQZ85091.1 Stress response protein NhaX [Paenibacillus konkukensis]
MFSNILVAYDGSDLSRKALDTAKRLAAAAARIEILHVYQVPLIIVGEAVITTPALQQHYYEHEQKIDSEINRLISDLPSAKSIIKQGQPAKTILEHAAENGNDLIVIASRGLTAIDELFLGSTSHNVVQHAKTPVLVVK